MNISATTRVKMGYVFCGLVILGVAIYYFQTYSILLRDDVHERRVLTTLYQKVHLGDNREAVEAVIYQKLAAPWQIKKSSHLLSVTTPFAMGASNWNLYIVFEGGLVGAVFIRNADDFKSPPPNAPPDKGDYRLLYQ